MPARLLPQLLGSQRINGEERKICPIQTRIKVMHMSEALWDIYEREDSMQTGQEPDGKTTEETSTESVETASHSPSNARTTEKTTSPDGSENSTLRLPTTKDFLGLSSTSGVERLSHLINTPHSHLECWCNSSRKQASNDEHGDVE